MTTPFSLSFLPQACSSSYSIVPHDNFHGGFSATGLLPCTTSFSSIHRVNYRAQASVVGNFLSAFQEAAGGLVKGFRGRTLVWNSLQVSNCDNSLEPDSTSGLVFEGFYDVEFGAQVALNPHEQQCGSAAPSGGTVRVRKEEFRDGESELWSIVIPTYNRLPILTKCLQALEEQRNYSIAGIDSYEVIVVDDGSTDGTVEFLTNENMAEVGNLAEVGRQNREAGYSDGDTQTGSRGREELGEPNREELEHVDRFPHVRLVQQKHTGATTARNLGLKYAKGAVIVFIDSDLIVTESFLKAHGEALRDAFLEDGDDRAFTYGRVVNTSNFHDPKSEKVKLLDHSAAFFATGNVAISHRLLLKAGELLGGDADGPFDAEFSEYGWEDLELGVRLKQCGARIKHAPAAVGYHWHPAFSVEQLPKLIEQERQRGRNGVHFYHKHPTLNVRLMVQMTPFHEVLWFLLTLGGFLNERTIEPILWMLVVAGKHRTAAALVSPILNWHTVQAVKEELRKLNVR